MDWPLVLLAAHTASTLAMTGLIWFVQVVHYPLFLAIDDAGFASYEQRHVTLTGRVVAPLMLIELATSGLLVLYPPTPETSWLCYLGFAMVAVNWLSTAFLQVPLHGKLQEGKDEQAIRRLVRTNWIRTIAWSGRGVVACAIACT